MASIKEVSAQFQLSQDTLRYYERIGLIPNVHRNANGIRDYQKTDISWVEFIKCMRNAGLSIECLIDYVALFQKGNSTIAQRKALLLEQRDLLAKRVSEMQSTLERLDRKIEGYEEGVLQGEKRLKKKEAEKE